MAVWSTTNPLDVGGCGGTALLDYPLYSNRTEPVQPSSGASFIVYSPLVKEVRYLEN